jgi:hypothetical protein
MRGNQMKTLVSDGSPIEMIESETDCVGGGAPKEDVGHHWGAGRGYGLGGTLLGPGQGNGLGAENNDDHGRF